MTPADGCRKTTVLWKMDGFPFCCLRYHDTAAFCAALFVCMPVFIGFIRGQAVASAFIQRDAFWLRVLPAILSDVVSAAWRGGDRRPEGAEAPPPPGRSSRVRDSGRATPYAARQGGVRRGRPAEKSFPSERAAADGVGGCRGQGAGKPLPPAPRRGGDHTRGPGRSRRPRPPDSAKTRVALRQPQPQAARLFLCCPPLRDSCGGQIVAPAPFHPS